MSLNVFLVFFCNVNPTSFKKYTWLYCLVCYGGPLVPAVTLVSIRGDPRGPVFGNAAVSRENTTSRRLSAHILDSSGAGFVQNGALCACIRTTSLSGFASSCPFSSISLLVTTFSTTEINSRTLRSRAPSSQRKANETRRAAAETRRKRFVELCSLYSHIAPLLWSRSNGSLRA